MNILITGGAGFIGSNLAKFHLQKNDEVFVIDNLITGRLINIRDLIKNKRFIFFQTDLLNLKFNKLPSFDIIYHLASPASPPKFRLYPIEILEVNSVGTKKILDFILESKSGVLVFTSSSEVYGDPTVHPQTETYWGNVNPVGIRSPYNEGKRFAEALIMAYFRKFKLDLRIGRVFNTYGNNMDKNDGRVVSNFITQSLLNKPLTVYGDGTQTRSFCFVSDMILGLYKLATTKNIAGEIINLGNPTEKNILELAHLIKNITHSRSKIIFSSKKSDDPKRRKPDITKAKKLLGWEPKVSLEQGLSKTIEYYKKQL